MRKYLKPLTWALGLALLVGLVSPAEAQNVTKNMAAKDQICPLMEQMAQGVMELRQSGESMSAVMAISKQFKIDKLREIYRLMVIDAFNEPDYQSKSFRQNQVRSFGARYAKMCYTTD